MLQSSDNGKDWTTVKVFALKLKRNGITNVKCCSLHPGVILTNICNNFWNE